MTLHVYWPYIWVWWSHTHYEWSLQRCKSLSSDSAVGAVLLGHNGLLSPQPRWVAQNFAASKAVSTLLEQTLPVLPHSLSLPHIPPQTHSFSACSFFPPGANTLRQQTLPDLWSRWVIWMMLIFSQKEWLGASAAASAAWSPLGFILWCSCAISETIQQNERWKKS